jgi:hypothetical protein
MRTIILTIAFTHLLFFGSLSQSKDTLTLSPVGISALETAHLHSYSEKYDFYSVRTDGTEALIGGLEDVFVITGDAGKKKALRIARISIGSNFILDSGLCELNGLRPVYHKSSQTKKKMSFDFVGEHVTGSILYSEVRQNEQIDYESKVPLFDSYYEDIIAKCLPFKAGLVVKFPEYIYERGGTVWSTGEVVGMEEEAGNVQLWTIKFYELDSNKGVIRTTTYKIQETGRRIISREYLTKGGRMIMRLRHH